MLKSLYISNYALIDKLNIEFSNGFSAITGETGAGKSILIGALSLILGKRADSTVLFNKESKCVVEGIFDISSLDLKVFFENYELDYDEQTILRREIAVNGKSRAFINDTPVKSSTLKEIGNILVDIHSQHETLNLNKQGFQIDVIDKFGTDEEILLDYTSTFNAYKSDRIQLESLKSKNESSRRDEEYFKFQFNELEEAQIDEEEIKGLIEKEKLLSHAEEVNAVIEMANTLMVAEESSIYDKVSELVEAFGKLSNYHDNFKDIYQRLTSVNIELKDIAGEISNLSIDDNFDQDSLQNINNRLNLIYTLQQKHSVNTIAELIGIREEFEQKLDGISYLETEIKTLAKKIEKSKTRLLKIAKSINQQRQKSAKSFSTAVSKLINKLGMPDAAFIVELSPLIDLSPTGLDKVEFLLNPNKGGIAAEISKIASGGELSRLMLAVKSLITNKRLLPTIVFDEIDTGVSGDIAGKVGSLLNEMSTNHQLIAITHLPQIAAKSKHHYFVYKQINKGKTYSNIRLLDNQERVEEVAKMLSDEKVSTSAREAAKVLMGVAN